MLVDRDLYARLKWINEAGNRIPQNFQLYKKHS